MAKSFAIAARSNWHHYQMIKDNSENQYACATDVGKLLMHQETSVVVILKEFLYLE